MKSKLHVVGLVFVSFLFCSCSDDYDLESIEKKRINVKISHQTGENDELKFLRGDSTHVCISKEEDDEGDPSNPKPPRP